MSRVNLGNLHKFLGSKKNFNAKGKMGQTKQKLLSCAERHEGFGKRFLSSAVPFKALKTEKAMDICCADHNRVRQTWQTRSNTQGESVGKRRDVFSILISCVVDDDWDSDFNVSVCVVLWPWFCLVVWGNSQFLVVIAAVGGLTAVFLLCCYIMALS